METLVEDGGIVFSVRVLAGLEPKDRKRTIDAETIDDPFADPEPDLRVAEVPPAHRLLLNKFPVFADHLLLTTRAFEEQESPLTEADLAALLAVLGDALAFYNAGAVAGASQRHKHLQLIPTPIGHGAVRFPTEVAIAADALPFATYRAALPASAAEAHAVYRDLAARAGVATSPHNLLVTSEALVIVPRTVEDWRGVSVNALGFAGSILLRDEAQLEEVRRVGPLALLSHVAQARRG